MKADPVQGQRMPQSFTDPDPYAELDNRADADELDDAYRKPIKVRRLPVKGPRSAPR